MAVTENLDTKNGRPLRIAVVALFTVAIASAVAFYVYSSICPCGGTPGGLLFGERIEEPINDWRIVNEVDTCQLQIAAGIRPHSINLNCWATPEGVLYVGCMGCAEKYWGYRIGPDERGFIKVAERVYPVTINRVENPEEMDRIWSSRFFKLQQRSTEPVPVTGRAEGWWAFSVVSRSP